ncbi:M20/M25/M40 family metallo-hydrolase [Candidatus Woesearchaeota archaeon]|nr:M20/M25/M40 family metallo-hydrolase [Candidatus Woesearchaeota archaeon]
MDYKKIKEEIITLTKKLILFRTTEDRGEELFRCIQFIKNYFNGTNVIIKEFCYKNKPSLFVSFNKRKKQDLILNGHIDVVEGFYSQFVAETEGSKLYGRGSADMKTAVATMIVLMKNLARISKPPKVGLMIVSDEEIGGSNGTKQLLKRGYRSDFGITGETSKFNIETKHKGSLQVKIISYGSSSHSSRPWRGSNAIEKLIRQYQRLLNEIPTATSKQKWLASINPTNIIATGPYNVTPSKAEMVLDIRTTEEYTNRKILNILKKLNIKYKKILDGNMMFTKNNNAYVRSLKKITEQILNKKVKYIKSCGGSDTRFFTLKEMPAVNFGPIGKNHHKHNEYVKLDSIEPYYRILEKFIKENFLN